MRHEVAGDRLVAVDDAGIRREHHVRQFGLGLDRDDLGVLGNRVAQVRPLLLGELEAHGPPSLPAIQGLMT